LHAVAICKRRLYASGIDVNGKPEGERITRKT